LAVFGCDQFEENITMEEIQLISPFDNATLTTGEILFRWSKHEDVNEYQFQLVSPSFEDTTRFLKDTVLMEDDFSEIGNQINLNLPPGTYEWRVRGLNFGTETEFSSRNILIE